MVHIGLGELVLGASLSRLPFPVQSFVDGSLVAFSGKGDLCDWYTNDVLETADDVDFTGG